MTGQGRMTSLKKILVLGEPGSGKLTFLKALTGSLPDSIPSSHGGLTHDLNIKNAYYAATVGIWVDEFPRGEAAGLCDSYVSDEAREVRDSLGAIIVTFRVSTAQNHVTTILEQVKRIAELCESETILLAIGTPHKHEAESSKVHDEEREHDHETVEWEDLCLDEGFEFVNLAAQGKNTFGEEQGVRRALQAIEACDWSATVPDLSEEELLAEMMAEDAALNEKLLSLDTKLDTAEGQPDEASVEELERMMQRVLMAREHLQDLSPEERKKQAAKLVSEIMTSSH